MPSEINSSNPQRSRAGAMDADRVAAKDVDRVAAIDVDRVAADLLQRMALLTRLLARELRAEMPRTELGVLNTLSQGPRRITELAELEGVAQPTMTLLVSRLETGGLVERIRDEGDGRVVMVSRTAAGAAIFEEFRARAAAVLGEYLGDLGDDQVAALAFASETLGTLIGLLQR